jgi:hypothetical protein
METVTLQSPPASSLQHPLSTEAPLLRVGGRILIATHSNRNGLNSPNINATRLSNRNEKKGSHGPGEERMGDTKGVSITA